MKTEELLRRQAEEETVLRRTVWPLLVPEHNGVEHVPLFEGVILEDGTVLQGGEELLADV